MRQSEKHIQTESLSESTWRYLTNLMSCNGVGPSLVSSASPSSVIRWGFGPSLVGLNISAYNYIKHKENLSE